MFGTLIFIPKTDLKAGQQIAFGQTKDNKDHPNVIGVIVDVQPEEGYKYSNVKPLGHDWSTPVPHSYFKGIAVQWTEYYTWTNQGRDGATEESEMTLPLREEDWKYAIEHIGESVMFKQDGTVAQLIFPVS